MGTDRHKISSNALNDITSSIIRESQGRIEDFVLSETSTLKGRQKLCCKKVDNVKEKFLVDVESLLHNTLDEKLLKPGKAFNHNERLAVLTSATNGKLVKLMGTTDLDRGNGLNRMER